MKRVVVLAVTFIIMSAGFISGYNIIAGGAEYTDEKEDFAEKIVECEADEIAEEDDDRTSDYGTVCKDGICGIVSSVKMPAENNNDEESAAREDSDENFLEHGAQTESAEAGRQDLQTESAEAGRQDLQTESAALVQESEETVQPIMASADENTAVQQQAAETYAESEEDEIVRTPVAGSIPALNFQATDIRTGSPVNLSGFYGKPHVVNIWATWCGACTSELPAFNSVYERYKNDVTFLMVNASEAEYAVSSYIESKGYTFPVYLDDSYSAQYAYDIRYLPTTIFIDSSGNIIDTKIGSMNESTLIDYLKDYYCVE